MLEDKYIWEEFKNEKDYALSYIYHQYFDFLFYYGKKFTNDEDFILDIIQDIYFDLIRTRKNLGTTDNIRLYLVKSFRRRLFREIKKNKKLTEDNSKYYELEPKIVFSAEDDYIRNEGQEKKLELVRKGIQELNPKQREVIYYKFTCGFEYKQICEIMSINYDTARQLVSRAVSSLKKYLSESDFIYFFVFRRLRP